MRSRTTDVIQQFAEWLSQTSLSMLIQTHNAWVIPTIQSIHIIAIGVVLTSVLMIDLRILGRAGRDQTLRETTEIGHASRFVAGSMVPARLFDSG